MRIEENLPKNITFHLPPGRESSSVENLTLLLIIPTTIIVFILMSWLLPVTPLTQLLSLLSPFPNDIALMQKHYLHYLSRDNINAPSWSINV